MSDMPTLNCRDTTWLVSDARERPLTPEETAALASHISDCRFCQGASRQFEVLFRGVERYLESEASREE